MSLYNFVVLATLVAAVVSQGPQVNTPSSVQSCLPVQLSWTGGQGPYFLSLIPGGQPGGATVEDFGQQTGNTFSWKVNLPADPNKTYTIQVRDSTGALNYSDKFAIQPSSQTCDTSGSSSSAGSSGNSSTATGGSTAAPTKGSTTPSPSGGATNNATTKPTTGTSTTSPSTGSTTSSSVSSGSSPPASEGAKAGAAGRLDVSGTTLALGALLAVFA